MARGTYQNDDLSYSYDDEFTTMQQPSAPSDPWADQGGFDQMSADPAPSSVFAPGPSPSQSKPKTTPKVQVPQAGMTPSSLPLAQTPSGVQMLQGAAQPEADAPATSYDQTMQELEQTSDPNYRAILQDKLARNLQRDLESAGHDVSWDGDHMVVDGRPYEIGGGAQTSGTLDQYGQNLDADKATAGTFFTQYLSENAYLRGDSARGYPADVGSALEQYQSQRRAGLDHNRAVNATLQQLGWDDPRQWGGGASGATMPTGGGSSRSGTSRTSRSETPAAAPVRPTTPGFTPSFGGGRGYTPDVPMDDLPNFSYEELMGNDEIDKQLDAKLQELLMTPEGLSDVEVERLKAKSKEELLGFQDQNDDELRRLEFEGGLEGSRWLDSERLRGKEARDTALVGNNREIDIQAAEGRAEDRRATIALGQQYQTAKSQRRQLAADAVMKQAALKGDRIALRETAKQRAAELNISEQQVLANYTLGLLDNATRQYGMDLDAMLAREGFEIDWARIDSQDSQYWADLAHRTAVLEEEKRQYNYDYGLKVADTNARNAPTGGA